MRRLIIKPNPTASDADPAKYHTHIHLDDGSEPRIILAGFSYFGEIGGLRHIPPDKHVVLYPERDGDDWKRVLKWGSSDEHIRCTFRPWLKFLADHHVNLVRAWVFDLNEADSYPFFHRFGQSLYNLQAQSTRYLRRLIRFIDLARIHGIVVHLTLSSDQMLRGPQWPKFPFHPNHAQADPATGTEFFTTSGSSFLDFSDPRRQQIERTMISWLTAAVKPFWNVMFEVVNEGGFSQDKQKVADWARTIRGWLVEDLKDAQGNRTHLITTSAVDDRIYNAVTPDIISLHGGGWGGSPETPDPTADTRNKVRDLYNRFTFPFAVICDSDAFAVAQNDPKTYAAVAVQNLKLNYAHRWSDRFLSFSLLYSQINSLAASIGGLPFYGGISPSPAPTPAVSYAEAEVAGSWQPLGLPVRDVGCFRNDSVWAIGNTPTPGGFTLHHWLGGESWEQVPGGGVRIAVGPDGPWIVNDAHNIYRWTGTSWQLVGGSANDIGIGADGTVWIINNTAAVGGFQIQRRDGNAWTTIDGGALRIAVSPNGEPWVVNNGHTVYYRDADRWIQTPGSATDVGCSLDDTTWIIGTNAVPGGYGISYWTGTEWHPIDGGGVNIAGDEDGLPLVTNNVFNIYHRVVPE